MSWKGRNQGYRWPIKVSAVDIPTIPADVLIAFQDESYEAVLDVGGILLGPGPW